MDHQFCPGARTLRQPKPEIFACPGCGGEVEIWTDEIRGTCSACDRAVFRDGYMSCLEWCKYGKECVGEEVYGRYVRNRAAGLRRKLLEAVQSRRQDDPGRIRHRQAVLSWAEKMLEVEQADWHIVIPASILHDMVSRPAGPEFDADGEAAAREILLRAGLQHEEIERICAVGHGDDSAETRVLHDAELLADLEEGKADSRVFLTETGNTLARVRLSWELELLRQRPHRHGGKK